MNSQIKIQNQNNAPAKLERLDFIMFSLFYLALGVALPIILFSEVELAALQTLSLVVSAVWLLLLRRLAHSARPIIAFAITIGAIYFTTGSFLLCGALSALAASVVIPAVLLARSPSLPLTLVPFAACALICAIGAFYPGGLLAPALSVATLVPAVIEAFSLKKRLARVSSVSRLSAGFVFSLLLLAALWIVGTHSTISLSLIKDAVSSLKESLIAIYVEAIKLVAATAGQSFYPLDIIESARVTVSLVFNMLPALIIIAAFAISYILHSLTLHVWAAYEEKKESLVRMSAFDMSLHSAIVFLVAGTLAGIFSGEVQNVYTLTALNIAVVLMPGLAFNAILALRQMLLAKTPTCSGFLFYAIFVMLFLNYTAYASVITALAGAVLIIVNHVRIFIKKKQEK